MTNTNNPREIARQLMELDGESPGGRERYEETLRSLFDRKIGAADWVRLALMGVGGLGGAVVCGSLAITEPATTPVQARVALGVLAAIGMTWAALAGVVVRRGSVHARTHGTAAATLGFVFSLVAAGGVALMSGFASARPVPAGVILLPLATLLLATVVLILHHVRLAELRLRRDVLEAEYRLSRRRDQ